MDKDTKKLLLGFLCMPMLIGLGALAFGIIGYLVSLLFQIKDTPLTGYPFIGMGTVICCMMLFGVSYGIGDSLYPKCPKKRKKK